MKAFRQGHRSIFIGEPVAMGATGSLAFTVARPRFDEDGGFAGAMLIAATPAYFENFYRESLPALRNSAGLVRSDGVFLVRLSRFAATSGTERAGATFLWTVTEGGARTWTGRSSIDGLERITTVRKLERFPVYVAFGIEMRAVLAEWRGHMPDYALFAIPAMIGLVSLSGLALARTVVPTSPPCNWQVKRGCVRPPRRCSRRRSAWKRSASSRAASPTTQQSPDRHSRKSRSPHPGKGRVPTRAA